MVLIVGGRHVPCYVVGVYLGPIQELREVQWPYYFVGAFGW